MADPADQGHHLADKRSEVPKGRQPLTPQVFKPVETRGRQDVARRAGGALMSDGRHRWRLPDARRAFPPMASGIFGDPDGNGAHGLNERMRVRSVYEGRDFLYEVVKIYAK